MQQKRYIGPDPVLYGRRAIVIGPGETIHEVTAGKVVAQFNFRHCSPQEDQTPEGQPECFGWREYPATDFQHVDLSYPTR